MKKDIEIKLQAEFPFMHNKCPLVPYLFKDIWAWMRAMRAARETGEYDFRKYSTYEQYGCACGDGWGEVIYGLCRDITSAYEKRGLDVDIVPLQIKEKFGKLRFYYKLSNTGESPLTFDFLNKGSSLTFSPNQSEIGKAIMEIVQYWQEISGQTCEICGAKGELRTDLSWKKTLCDFCYEPRKLKDIERKNTIAEKGQKATRGVSDVP